MVKIKKGKIYIVFGLHAYQPPTQAPEIVKQISCESYEAVAETLLESPESSIICADIALSLLELLEKYDERNAIELFKNCVNSKKLHLANTAAYHPLLPLIPNYYIKRQIEKNLKGYEKYFSADKNSIKGFFPPEMAFAERIADPIKNSGALWTMTDDTAFCAHYNNVPPYNKILKRNDLHIFLMSHKWHKIAAFGEIQEGRRFLDALSYGFNDWIGDNDGYIIIWMDWETFGHHDKKAKPQQNRIKNFLKPFLKEIALHDKFELATPDKLIKIFPKTIDAFVPDSSWSTSANDYIKGIIWPLWLHPNNIFHCHFWTLANYALSIAGETNNQELEELIDKALYSCQPWQWSHGNREVAKKGLEIFRQIFEHRTISSGARERGMRLVKEIEQL